MGSYRVVAIQDEVAEEVRATRRSPGYGHPAHGEVAKGYGPCRRCLRTFAVGAERRLLFTYDAFAGSGRLPLPGPVFIHEEACERYAEDGGFPADLRAHGLTFNAYAEGRRLVGQEYVEDGEVETAIERLLARPEVECVHVRDTGAGCFDFRIERAASGDKMPA